MPLRVFHRALEQSFFLEHYLPESAEERNATKRILEDGIRHSTSNHNRAAGMGFTGKYATPHCLWWHQH